MLHKYSLIIQHFFPFDKGFSQSFLSSAMPHQPLQRQQVAVAPKAAYHAQACRSDHGGVPEFLPGVNVADVYLYTGIPDGSNGVRMA